MPVTEDGKACLTNQVTLRAVILGGYSEGHYSEGREGGYREGRCFEGTEGGDAEETEGSECSETDEILRIGRRSP